MLCCIEPTAAQLELLAGPKTLDSLKVADFLGRQEYIDQWIKHWLEERNDEPSTLPLCVTESIYCYPKVRADYERRVLGRVAGLDVEWLERHFLVPFDVWRYVDFKSVPQKMFDMLWDRFPAPLECMEYLMHARRFHFFKRFMEAHGPTVVLPAAVRCLWYKAVQVCLEAGADINHEDVVVDCVRSPSIFSLVVEWGAEPTLMAYEEFKVQRLLNRVPDVPLVEQWFWIHGYNY